MPVTPLTELSAGGVAVRVGRVETPKGERLEIASGTASIRLDAVALEALTWQDPVDLDRLAVEESRGTPGPGGREESRGPPEPDEREESRGETDSDGPADSPNRTRLATVSNEFGFVVVYETRDESDAWIDLEAEKQGESIRLGPARLDAIARLDHDAVTGWIRADLNE